MNTYLITGFEVFYFYMCNANFTFNKEVSGYPFSSRTAIDGRLLKVKISQKQFFLLSILQKIGGIRKVLMDILYQLGAICLT